MIVLGRGGLSIELCEPRSYYRGTRFDACGVFRRIVKDGYIYADRWFDGEDAFRHDNVCGPSEEFFGVFGYDEAPVGGTFLKIGVGLLRKDAEKPYDWFHLYEIVDGGRFSLRIGTDTGCNEDHAPATWAEYSHVLEGCYNYVKRIEVISDDSFEISHRLELSESFPFRSVGNGGKQVSILQYCHNFFTFNGTHVGPSRRMDFPVPPRGEWRADSVHGYLEGNSLLFDAPLQPGEMSYIGNLQLLPSPGNFSLVLSEGGSGRDTTVPEAGHKVTIVSDRPLDHMVMWACPRVACPEPYLRFGLDPGESASWKNTYSLH